ncbi:Susd and RagB outer membrane lipoprotein [Saccharicrinis carchari]|uniref:Susd and RagB outer membrane lipoprotein n=1 Tax=Saccharicrinis carchari TaxID=1168039 RepID=A0A521CY20_SACCC|nr:SusD/RagB family nutrient-binding outer membrane lipoprotein [Saccharicrinis carchari]SMO64329.1 Susd and RagB outer membrane lipoprotein [Saccharicrinis carchari]
MNRNNYLIYVILMVLPLFGGSLLTSCTDGFEKMNTSDVQVDPADLPFDAQFTEPMVYCYPPQQNMFQFWTNLTIDMYGGYFMTPHGNFTNADMGENRGHSGGMYENYYLHIFNNSRRLIAQSDADGNKGLAGIMRVVQSYGTLMTTDAYGPIPYSSILSGENEVYFEFDSQKQIFKSMIEDLDIAIKDISAMEADEIAKLQAFDSWCGGDTDLWVKAANTIKLRLALRLSKREPEALEAGMNLKQIATEAAANTLATVNKDILIDKNLENNMWLMFAWGDCGFNANLVTLMSGMNDPRQPLYMTKNTGDIKNEAGEVTMPEGTDYVGIRFASGLPPKGNNWANFSGWIQGDNGSSYSMPLPIMKAAEAYFLLAEAKLRWDIGSSTAQELYEQGIRVSMQNELDYRGDYAGVNNYEDGAIDDYINGTSTQIDFVDPADPALNSPALNKLSVKWDEGATKEEKLERIITQKWLALFPLSTEGWAEQRRTGYPHFFPAFVNKSGGDVNKEEGVRRVIFSGQAYDANEKGVNTGIELLNQSNTSKTGISGDKGGTRIWWDNADRGNF